MSDNWVNWNIMPTVSSVTKNNKVSRTYCGNNSVKGKMQTRILN